MRKTQYTGVEFEQIMFGEPNEPLVMKYLQQEFDNASPTQMNNLREDEKEGPRARNMVPVDLYGFRTLNRESIYSDTAFPQYAIAGPVNVSGKEINWPVQITRCRFSDLVTIKDLSSVFGIRFDQCVFDKGLLIENVHCEGLGFSGIENLSNVKIDGCTLLSLSFSQVVLPPQISDSRVRSLNLSPYVKH